MLIERESVLFVDLQQAVPRGYCEACGGALYASDGWCIRCRRRKP